MKTLYRLHFLSLAIYVFGITGGVFLFKIAKSFFEIHLPIRLLAFVVLLCLFASALLRISAWKNKDALLTKEEQNCFGTHIFFLLAVFEILVAIIGAGIIFLY